MENKLNLHALLQTKNKRKAALSTKDANGKKKKNVTLPESGTEPSPSLFGCFQRFSLSSPPPLTSNQQPVPLTFIPLQPPAALQDTVQQTSALTEQGQGQEEVATLQDTDDHQAAALSTDQGQQEVPAVQVTDHHTTTLSTEQGQGEVAAHSQSQSLFTDPHHSSSLQIGPSLPIQPAPPPPLLAFKTPHLPQKNNNLFLELAPDDDDLNIDVVNTCYNNLNDITQIQETNRLLTDLDDTSTVSSIISISPSSSSSSQAFESPVKENKNKKKITIKSTKEKLKLDFHQQKATLSSSTLSSVSPTMLSEKYWILWRREMAIKEDMENFHKQIAFLEKKLCVFKKELHEINILKNKLIN